MLSSLPPRKEYLWIELLRQATPAQRITQTRIMTAIAMNRSRQEIAQAHPELSPEELRLKFIEVHYGRELADQVREYLRTQ